MSARTDQARSVPEASSPEIEFARGAENFPVARLGDMVLAMLPARDERRHAGDWIVIAALRSEHHPGMTEVIATIGGQRGEGVEKRRFLVASEEYGETGGRFGFVVDPARHTRHDEPSGFALRADRAELARMEEARRVTQRQLDIIERDIARRIAYSAIFAARQIRPAARASPVRASDTSTFRRRYRETLAALTAERQPETDALARKLGRQDLAIDAFHKRHGHSRADP